MFNNSNEGDSMREKYESLSLSALRDVAKARGIKNISTMKKSDLVEAMLMEDEKVKEANKENDIANSENQSESKAGKLESKIAETEIDKLDSGIAAKGILEVLPDGYGFIRCENYLPGENDVYVSPSQIRKFNLKTGEVITGSTRKNNPNDKFGALLFITSINISLVIKSITW